MEKKIVVFGDSISKGIVSEGEKLLKLDSDAATLIEEKYGYTIINQSRYGMTLKRLCERRAVEKFLDQTDGVEYAVLCIGGNDADYDWKAVGENPQLDHGPVTPIEEFYSLLEGTIELLQERGVNVMLCTIPPVDAVRYFDNVICRRADGDRVLEFLNGDLSNISRHQEAYNSYIVGCAVKHGCPVIDLRTGFLLDRRYLSNYCVDGVHPNCLGHRFMAEQIVLSLARQGVFLKKRVKE